MLRCHSLILPLAVGVLLACADAVSAQTLPGDCASFEVLGIECDPTTPGDYTLTFELTNLSGTAVSLARLLAEDASLDGLPDYEFTPESFSVLLPPGGSTTLTTQMIGASPPVACFELWLFDSDFEQCCVLSICVDLPPCTDEPRFIRCDCNADGLTNIADAIFTLGFLFGGGSAPCLDACDGNDDGVVNIGDVISCLSALFGGGPPPPPPFPDCGPDPTLDSIRCDSFPPCR